MTTIDLSGQTAIVTGGGQGLGAQTIRTLHAAGANVVINYFADPAGHNATQADALAAELGGRAIAICGDVRDVPAVEALFAEATSRFGGVDIVVNNAGILRDRSVKKMTDAEWQAVIDTNLTGVFHVCRAAATSLRDGGRIINLASIAGALGFFGQANYASAKAGVMGLTKVLAKELARRQIRVNAVAPGVVLTEMGKSIPDDHRAKMLEAIPLGHFGEPADIANAILFLASPLSAYITGQTLHVNGGWHAP